MSTANVNKFAPGDNALPLFSPIVQICKELISQAWGFTKTIQYNPSPNPVSFEKKHLPILSSNLSDYVVTEKSDGVRYLLILGTHEKKGFAVMMNRKMDAYEVPLYANEEYFKGSIFDGEMVVENISPTQERQYFMIFDSVMIRGETKRNENLLKRYHEYVDIFQIDKDILSMEIHRWEKMALDISKTKNKIVSLGNRMALQFKPKPYVTLMNIGSLWRTLVKSQHKIDGLIISKTSAPIGTNTDVSTLKWKPHHTIDLIVEGKFSKGGWVYQLFFQDREKLVQSMDKPFQIGSNTYYLTCKSTPTLENTSIYFGEIHKNLFKLLGEWSCNIDPVQPIIWCTVDRWRTDKNTPNNSTVIERTLQNIEENVSIEEIIKITGSKMYGIQTDL